MSETSGTCAACGRTYLSRVGVFRDDAACPSCGKPICSACWGEKIIYCQEHEEVPVAQLVDAPKPGAVPPAEIPPGAVARQTAREMEEGFLSRVRKNFRQLGGIFNPVDGRWYDVVERNIAEYVVDLGAEAAKNAVRDKAKSGFNEILAGMPTNRAAVCDVFTRDFLGARQRRVSLAGASLSALDELVTPGWSARPLGFTAVTAAQRRLVTDAGVFYYLCYFSTTGWSQEARDLLANGPNFVACLVEKQGDAWRIAAKDDGRWGDALAVYDLETYAEKRERVAAFVKRNTYELLMDRVTDRFVCEKTGLPLDVVRAAFRDAANDPFLHLTEDPDQFRLSRVY
ncbi:MAG: hypothetical protein HYY18_23595 [Planctomycetes bacterium]|nr:hypothetical protein [Planctomycetota bacterium]